jgi:hypothetical protein
LWASIFIVSIGQETLRVRIGSRRYFQAVEEQGPACRIPATAVPSPGIR